MSRKIKCFTLIELLIVIAIISILAAIAVPNYQDALSKSKCAKFMGDCKALETAIEVYSADRGGYPPEDRYPPGSSNYNWNSNPTYPATGFTSRLLTTPVAYLTKLPVDPFPNHCPSYSQPQFPERRPYNFSNDMQNAHLYEGSGNQFYCSWTYQSIITPQGTLSRNNASRPNAIVWMISSAGPDGDRDHGNNYEWVSKTTERVTEGDFSNYPIVYDPTNGTLSNGDLFFFGPGVGMPGT